MLGPRAGLRTAAGLAATVALGAPHAALAQQRSPTELAQAHELFRAGVRASQQAHWADALDAFARAYALNPNPSTLFNLAGAQAETGHLLLGAESYRRFLAQATDDASAPMRRSAEDALRDLERRTPHARVDAPGLEADDVALLDGLALAREALGAPLPLDAGAHAITIRRGDRTIASVAFTVREGETRDVPLAPVALVAPAAVTRPVPPAQTVLRAPRSATRARPLIASPWLWSVVGVLVTGAAVAAVVVATRPTAAAGFEPYSGNATPPELPTP